MLREMCRSFADNELAPNAGEWDKNHTFPKDQVRQRAAPDGCARNVSQVFLVCRAAAAAFGRGLHSFLFSFVASVNIQRSYGVCCSRARHTARDSRTHLTSTAYMQTEIKMAVVESFRRGNIPAGS